MVLEFKSFGIEKRRAHSMINSRLMLAMMVLGIK